MSTVLVTGGWGCLGRKLVERLGIEGHRVRVLTRPSHRSSPRPTTAGEEVVFADIRDGESVARAVAGVDVVFHLVSNFRHAGSDEKEAYSVNVEGTLNVVRSVAEHRTPRVIHCSTIGVHGSVLEIPANEESPFNPGDAYQETKLIAERKVWDLAESENLAVTVIRPISIYGPGDTRMLKLFRMIQRGWFVRVGSGEALFQPAYIDDVVEGFVLAMANERSIGEAIIVGSDSYLTLNDLVHTIAAEMGVKLRIAQLPTRPMEWAAIACELLSKPLSLEPPLHRRRLSFFRNNRAFSIEKAKSLLGFQPSVSLEEGIRRTLSWYRRTHLL